MKNYIITSSTLAILPNNRGGSIIYEDNSVFEVNLSPTIIIKRNCL